MRNTGEAGTSASDGRPNSFDVDLGAIAHNVGVLRSVLPSGTRIFAAVKANAYGFGLLPVARTLKDAGVDGLGLVDIRDAARLREDGIGGPILLYAGSLIDERTIQRVREHDLIVTIGDDRSLAVAASFAVRPGMQVGVVPMGFADGLAFLTCGAALVRGVRAPILGNLSLEHVSIDVTGIPDAAAGDEVVFIGRQAAAEVTQEEVMARQRADLPPASLAAAVRETVPRVYRPANSPPSPAAGQRYTPFVESANERLNGLAH
jgi:alanine racemase